MPSVNRDSERIPRGLPLGGFIPNLLIHNSSILLSGLSDFYHGALEDPAAVEAVGHFHVF